MQPAASLILTNCLLSSRALKRRCSVTMRRRTSLWREACSCWRWASRKNTWEEGHWWRGFIDRHRQVYTQTSRKKKPKQGVWTGWQECQVWSSNYRHQRLKSSHSYWGCPHQTWSAAHPLCNVRSPNRTLDPFIVSTNKQQKFTKLHFCLNVSWKYIVQECCILDILLHIFQWWFNFTTTTLFHCLRLRGKATYLCFSHLVAVRLQVQLTQAFLDVLPGSGGARRQQHAEVMDEILQQRSFELRHTSNSMDFIINYRSDLTKIHATKTSSVWKFDQSWFKHHDIGILSFPSSNCGPLCWSNTLWG